MERKLKKIYNFALYIFKLERTLKIFFVIFMHKVDCCFSNVMFTLYCFSFLENYKSSFIFLKPISFSSIFTNQTHTENTEVPNTWHQYFF